MIPVLVLHMLGVLGFDYDEVLMICTGLAAVACILVEYRRERRSEEVAHELIDRVARLEATSTDAMQIEQRLSALEIKAERDERFEERLSGYAERIAALEVQLNEVEFDEDEDDVNDGSDDTQSSPSSSGERP